MHDRMRAVGIGAAIVGGAGFAIQSKINGLLGHRLHDGLAAALISFLSGLVIVGAIILARAANRRSVGRVVASLRDGSLAWWQCLGGLCGAALVASQGVSVAALGVAVFTVAVVAGQTFAGLAVDRAGLGPGGPRPLTPSRVFGAVIGVGAVILAVANEFGSPRILAYALLPLIAGAATSWQQAVNGQVRVASGRVEAATLVNFVAGTVALVVAYFIDVAFRGTPTGDLPTAPWYYLGGAIGVVSIAIGAGVVRHTGVLLLTLGLVAGQLIAALVIDTIAPGAGGRPSALTLAGVALTLVAVAIAAAPSPWRWRRSRNADRDQDFAKADR